MQALPTGAACMDTEPVCSHASLGLLVRGDVVLRMHPRAL